MVEEKIYYTGARKDGKMVILVKLPSESFKKAADQVPFFLLEDSKSKPS